MLLIKEPSLGVISFVVSDDENRQASAIDFLSIPVQISGISRNEERSIGLGTDVEALVLSLDVVLKGQMRWVGVGGQGELAIGVSNVVNVVVVVDGSENPLLFLLGVVKGSELDGATDSVAEGTDGNVSRLPEDRDFLSSASENRLLAERSVLVGRILTLIVRVSRSRRKALNLRLGPELRVEGKSVRIKVIGQIVLTVETIEKATMSQCSEDEDSECQELHLYLLFEL